MKKLGFLALASFISITAVGATTTTTKKPTCQCNNNTPQAQTYRSFIFSTHHSHENIPQSFVGTYSKQIKLGKEQFTIDKLGHLKGHFLKKGKNGKQWDMRFNGVTTAMGKDLNGKQRLIIRYVISSANLKNLNPRERSSVDLTGELFLDKPYNKHAHSTIIGSYGNYIYLNNIFGFKPSVKQKG